MYVLLKYVYFLFKLFVNFIHLLSKSHFFYINEHAIKKQPSFFYMNKDGCFIFTVFLKLIHVEHSSVSLIPHSMAIE